MTKVEWLNKRVNAADDRRPPERQVPISEIWAHEAVEREDGMFVLTVPDKKRYT